MQIKDLKPNAKNIDVQVEVIEKGEVRTFSKFGNPGRVCTCVVKDDSGKVQLTLWNDEVDKVNVGDKVKISNGFVREFQGEMQLSAGRFGKIEKV